MIQGFNGFWTQHLPVFYFFPFTGKTFECMLGFSFIPMQSECHNCLSTCFFFFLRTVILVWRMQTRCTEASEFQTLTHEKQSCHALRMCQSMHEAVNETPSSFLSAYLLVWGNKIHRICYCSFNSMFQKLRHNRINKEFLTAYHQFWENVHISQQMFLIADLWT